MSEQCDKRPCGVPGVVEHTIRGRRGGEKDNKSGSEIDSKSSINSWPVCLGEREGEGGGEGELVGRREGCWKRRTRNVSDED